MSFILDALKKSESDRLKKDAPGFSDVPSGGRQKSASHWIWIVIVLIVVNITVLTVMFMNPERTPDAAIAVTSTDPTSSRPPAPDITENVAGIEKPSPAPAEVVAAPIEQLSIDRAPRNTQPTSTRPAGGGYEIRESLATFNDLRAQGILRLPDLHLDIHVYSNEPEDRFVFVNMSKYKEKATLDEGPLVTEITPDGVILEYRGKGFLLPRE